MQLVFDTARARYEAVTVFGEQDAPKAAGFRWDGTIRRWHGTPLQAVKLREYADEATRARLDDAAKAAVAAKAVADEAARVAVAASRAQDADLEIPCAPGRTFLPYQRAGIAYALAHPNVLIGDDMGLGKTAQAIGVTNADETLKKVLVVCPASLARNWVREFGFFGSRGLSVGISSTTKVPATDVVVATYSLFSMSGGIAQTDLLAREWDALILDEAHYCKNGDAKRTQRILGGKGMSGVRVRAGGRRMYLTGTPVPNRPVEAWPLVHSLAPAQFGSWIDYVKTYCDGYKGDYGWDVSGASNLVELQDKLRSVCMVRRLKSDVLTELPAKRRQIIEMAATTPQLRAVLKSEAEAKARHDAERARLQAAAKAAEATDDKAAYAQAVAGLRGAERVAFVEMSRVRHETAVAKAPMVAEHVRDALEGGDGKIIVFAHHRDVIDILRKELIGNGKEKTGFGCAEVTGDTDPAKRQDAVDAFQNDPKVRVFLGNIMAAGVGLTLTASAHVIFAELDWVPGNVSQAEDRAHRLGQRDSVLVQHLVLEGSMDADMARTITEKQAVIDGALDTVETAEVREERIAVAEAAKVVEEEAAMLAATAVLEERQRIDRLFADAKEAARQAADRRARREELEGPRPEEKARIDRQDKRSADWQDRMDAAIDKAYAALKEMNSPSDEACEAILAGLRKLANLDPDRAAERNNVGFSTCDSYFGHYLAGLHEIYDQEALVGKAMIRRYRRQLDAQLVAAALQEPVENRDVGDDMEQGDILKPIVLGAAEVMKLETAAEQPVPEESLEVQAKKAKIAMMPPVDRHPAIRNALEQLAETKGYREARTAKALGRMPDWSGDEALVCHFIVKEHPALLPADVTAAALGETVPMPVIEVLDLPVTVADSPKRRRGRPSNAELGRGAALSQVERNRRYRARRLTAAVTMPRKSADRLAAARGARGMTTGALMAEALDELRA